MQAVIRKINIPKAILKKYRQVGILGIARDGKKKLWELVDPHQRKTREAGRQFDRMFQTETTDIVPSWLLDLNDDQYKQSTRYVPTPIEIFEEIMCALRVNFENFCFVDLGSGKGRVLLLASQYRFQSITGVELSPSLCRIAEQNVRYYQQRNKSSHYNISVVCLDAQNFTFPTENLILFAYNPFPYLVTQKVLANIERTLSELPRTVYMIYLNPVHHQLIKASPSKRSKVNIHGFHIRFIHQLQTRKLRQKFTKSLFEN